MICMRTNVAHIFYILVWCIGLEELGLGLGLGFRVRVRVRVRFRVMSLGLGLWG